jgi:hypothetical protein
MNNVAVMNIGFGPDCWNTEIYYTAGVASQTFAAASEVTTAVHSSFKMMKLAWDLRSLSLKLSDFLDGIYKSCENAQKTNIKDRPSVSKEQVESAIRSLEYLYEVTTRLYMTAQKKRFTNNSMMATSLRTIHRRTEELMDLVDWFETALSHSSSELDDLYLNARKDLSEGKVFDLVR